MTHTITIHTPAGVRVERWEQQPDGSLKFAGVEKDTTGAVPNPMGLLPDGRYPCDADVVMPELNGNPADEHSLAEQLGGIVVPPIAPHGPEPFALPETE